MSSANWVSVIESLIETCKNGEYGYREAAAHVHDDGLKLFLEQQGEERGRFAHELTEGVSRISGVDAQGSVAAAVHRSWIGLQARLGRSDEAILNSVRQGERVAMAAYDAALSAALPPQFETIVRHQAESVRQAYERARSWKHKPAA